MFRISHYATASTNIAAYIIGGYDGSNQVSTIAEFKNNNWQNIGNLKEPKEGLSAIFHDGEHMIVGGRVYFGRWAALFPRKHWHWSILIRLF